MTSSEQAVVKQLSRGEQHSPVTTPGGASAALSADSEHCIQVFDEKQQLIFEYDAQAGVTRLSIPEGDLELATRQGSIRLKAADEVSLEGRDVNVLATESIGLRVIDLGKQLLKPVGSTLRLLPHQLRAAAQNLEVGADDANLSVSRLQYRGEELHAVVTRALGVFEKVETRAKSLWQTTDNLVSKVREAAQLRAGRVNQLVDGTIQVKSEKAIHKTRKDFKVQAERIHLG
ncbi:MAG: DUF3540 domain-containing protein [Ketobacteraceae bacterium]|nr:DUF3540 domain-containing protein [Ketobacteraceae bacterium]